MRRHLLRKVIAKVRKASFPKFCCAVQNRVIMSFGIVAQFMDFDVPAQFSNYCEIICINNLFSITKVDFLNRLTGPKK
jgi:hypothetical protein